MAWAVPEYEPQAVNAAGKALGSMAFPVDTTEGLYALSVINNWRSSHAYPLNTFQITLRNRSRRIEQNVIIAQREKRLDSIHRKLVSKKTMRMTQMQDIAGCRAVFTKLSDVYKLVDLYKLGNSIINFETKRITLPIQNQMATDHIILFMNT